MSGWLCLLLLISADRININQHFTAFLLDIKTDSVLIDIPQNLGFLATWWLHGLTV
jgi:hypothetical protein